MNLPRLRLRLRTLLAVVAILAVAIWAERMRRLTASYREVAAWHRERELDCLRDADFANRIAEDHEREAEGFRWEAEEAAPLIGQMTASEAEAALSRRLRRLEEDPGGRSLARLRERIGLIKSLGLIKSCTISLDTSNDFNSYAEADRRRAEHHAAMGRKYRHAALYPWLSPAPDPPEPRQDGDSPTETPFVGPLSAP